MGKLKGNKGFTLVELIVVIAVLALLAVGAVIAFQGVQANARRSARNADASALASALNLFNSRVADIPPDAIDDVPNRITDGAAIIALATAVDDDGDPEGLSTVPLIVPNVPGSPLGEDDFSVIFPNNGRILEIVNGTTAIPDPDPFIIYTGEAGGGDDDDPSTHGLWVVNTEAIASSR